MHKFIKILKIVTLLIFFLIFIGWLIIFTGAHYPNARVLTLDEQLLLDAVYGSNLDMSKIRLTFDTVHSFGSTKVIGNVIHFRDCDEYETNLARSAYLSNILIHEAGHVWQYQTSGFEYIPKSLYAQFDAWLKTGSRSNAYNWEDRLAKGVPWSDFNPEEQAQAISDYVLVREKNSWSEEDIDKLECFIPIFSRMCSTNTGDISYVTVIKSESISADNSSILDLSKEIEKISSPTDKQ